jgi:hypothetical protein
VREGLKIWGEIGQKKKQAVEWLEHFPRTLNPHYDARGGRGAWTSYYPFSSSFVAARSAVRMTGAEAVVSFGSLLRRSIVTVAIGESGYSETRNARSCDLPAYSIKMKSVSVNFTKMPAIFDRSAGGRAGKSDRAAESEGERTVCSQIMRRNRYNVKISLQYTRMHVRRHG